MEDVVVASGPVELGDVTLTDLRITHVSGPSEGYASWPQGKLRFHDGRLALLYNAGSAHAAPDLHVRIRTSGDAGRTWSAPATAFAEDGWARGCAAFSSGFDAAGDLLAVVRLRGRSFAFASGRPGRGTRHVAIRSRDFGATWERDPTVFPPLRDGRAPVLYHDFILDPNGSLRLGYHSEALDDVGLAVWTGRSVEHLPFPDSLLAGGGWCEPTLMREPGGALCGFLRTQIAGRPARFWRTATGDPKDAIGADAPAAVRGSPVSIVRHDASGLLIAASCGRLGACALTLHTATPDGAARGRWRSAVVARFPSIVDRSSGSGVQALAIDGERGVIAFGVQPPGQRANAAVCALSFRMESP